VSSYRPADTGVNDVDLDTFHGWFATDHSHTDESSTPSVQSPSRGRIYTGQPTVVIINVGRDTLFHFFVCTVTDLSAGALPVGVKFCVAVRPDLGQVLMFFCIVVLLVSMCVSQLCN